MPLPARLLLLFVGGGVTCDDEPWLDESASVEFFLVEAGELFADVPMLFLDERVLVPLMGRLAPEPRLRFLITSVFRLRGRTTP